MAMFHLATSKLKAGQLEPAIEEFKRSEAIEKTPAIQDGLGCCYHASRQYNAAITAFNWAINKEPRNIEFLKNRAQCYFDMGQYQNCIEDLA